MLGMLIQNNNKILFKHINFCYKILQDIFWHSTDSHIMSTSYVHTRMSTTTGTSWLILPGGCFRICVDWCRQLSIICRSLPLKIKDAHFDQSCMK
jgi:hypothetical protein